MDVVPRTLSIQYWIFPIMARETKVKAKLLWISLYVLLILTFIFLLTRVDYFFASCEYSEMKYYTLTALHNSLYLRSLISSFSRTVIFAFNTFKKIYHSKRFSFLIGSEVINGILRNIMSIQSIDLKSLHFLL